MSALVADRLACLRGGRLLFDALSFAVAPGAALAITGPNGAGKSSLLRILARLLRPLDGEVRNPFRAAYLGHENALKPQRSVRSELLFWARLDGAPSGAVDAALDRMSLTELAPLPIAMLSAGQRRRVALARVAVSGAPLWLLDEPTTGLDAASARRLAELAADHCARGGLVVATSHQELGFPTERLDLAMLPRPAEPAP